MPPDDEIALSSRTGNHHITWSRSTGKGIATRRSGSLEYAEKSVVHLFYSREIVYSTA